VYRIIKISFLFLLIISVQGLFAQVSADKIPNGIAIQSVARDASGNAASNRNIFLKVELRQGTASGEAVLIETHSVTSNDEGIFNFYIGQGARVSGITSLVTLDWKGKIYFLNIKMAIEPSLPTPGWVLEREYVDLGTSQIWSVPYAFSAYKAVVADSAMNIAGIVAGANGGTGVSNVGKTITLGRNFEIQGLGDLKFNTVGPTSLILPTKGTLVTSESLDTLINKYLLSPTFLGTPKTPTVDIKSNDSSVASTQFVKSVISSEINTLNTKLSTTLDTSAGAKLKISDTSAMLTSRFERDTASLSNRINLKVNTLNARIDSSLYVKGVVNIDSVVTINDSLRIKGNALIDTNLTVGNDLEVIGNLILNKGLEFNDSLVVQKGARIEQSILAKSKLYVADSVLAKGNVKIDNNLNVGKVTSLNDSLYVKGQARFDSLLTINDSLRVKGNVLIDTNLTVGKDLEIKGNLILNSGLQFNDSLIVSKGARIEQSILAKSKLYVTDSVLAKGNVKIDNNLNVGKVTSLNDSLYVKGQARFDSLLTINDSLRVKGNVLIDSNLTVLGRLSLSTALQFNDSLIVSKGARIDQSILAKSKLYVSDSILAKGNVLIDNNLNVGKVTSLNDSLYVKGQARFDSLLTINDSLRVKGNVLIDTNLTVNRITTLNDSLIVKGGARIDQSILAKSKLTVTDSLLAKGNVKIDNNLFVKGRNIDDSIVKFSTSKLNVSDTSAMLLAYLTKINDLYAKNAETNSDVALKLYKDDTISLSRRINLKVNAEDTAAWLNSRFNRDTASLSRRISNLVTGAGDLATLKLNILDTSFLLAKRDTAAMLESRFKRDTANLSRRLDLLSDQTFVNNNAKLNITDTSKLLQKKDTITLSNRIDAIALSSNVFTSDITLNMGSGKTFGKYANGETILSKGKSIDEVIFDIVTKAISPTYSGPSLSLSMGYSGNIEIGTNLGTLTFVPTYIQNDVGNITSISYKKNTVELTNNTGTPTVTDNLGTLSATTTYEVVYNYGAGTIVKPNNLGVNDPTGMKLAGSISASVTLTPISYRYWGMTTNSSASITDADIRAMGGGSRDYSSSKLKTEFTITGPGGAGPVKYAYYAVPHNASGTITSIKAGGFESIAAFDVITRDFVNALGYTVSYDIYVQKNSGTDNVTLIIN